MENKEEHRVYTLGTRPARTGVAGLSMKATYVGIVAFAMGILALAFQQWMFAFIIIGIAAVFIAATSISWGGRSVAERIQMSLQIAKRRFDRTDMYVSGPDSPLPGGAFQQPGMSAVTELIESVDAEGRPFGVILDVRGRKATVCLRVNLSGDVPRTLEERYEVTDRYGGWLASLSLSNDIDSAVTVVATRPATGSLIHREVEHLESPEGSPVAIEVCRQTADMLGHNVPEIETHTALTFNVKMSSPSDRDFLNQIVYRLPSIYRGLAWAGMDAVPMTAEQITARALTFNYPNTESAVEHLEVTGGAHGVRWEDAGPSVGVDMGDHYFHDGCRSVSWEMQDAPAATFEEGNLQPLLRPHPRIDRKRIVLIYRPYEASEGTKRVEKEWIDARNELTGQRARAKGRSEIREEQTNAARRSLARGAQLGRHSLMVTATVGYDADLNALEADITELAGQSNIRLQRMVGWQDAGFDISRGLGQLPWTKATTLSAIQ